MLTIFQIIIAFLLSLSSIMQPIGALIGSGGEGDYFEQWSSSSEYTSEYAVELEKQPGEDFKILNLADIQLSDIEAYGRKGRASFKLIDILVEQQQPDLITLTGDNAWGPMAYIELIKKLESYGIPWAPVMGNHDGEHLPSEFWAAYKLANAENCLFKFGPADMGYGNYIINITEGGKVIHTLFMMDTHSSTVTKNESGSIVSGYDGLWDNQLEWYSWAVDSISAQQGQTVSSTVFMHIPTPEFATAYSVAYDEGSQSYKGQYAQTSFGTNDEGVCSSVVNSGFFDLVKQKGSTTHIVVGHDHINNSSIVYNGVRLSYGLKTGFGSYYDTAKIGASVISVSGAGTASEHEQVFVSTQEIGIDPEFQIRDIIF